MNPETRTLSEISSDVVGREAGLHRQLSPRQVTMIAIGGEATAVAVYAVRMPWYPWTPLLGAASIVAILVTTWFVEGMRVTLLAGIPWLTFISICYFV